MSFSIVEYYGNQTSKCGYCNGTNCSKSHGMHAYRLSCDDYQELIDRGWRRCGNYCYKPENTVTCCPCYTIKCDALQFKLTKSNKRILRRMNKFLRDGKREPRDEVQQDSLGGPSSVKGGDDGDVANASEPQPQLPDIKPSVIDVDNIDILAQEHTDQLKTETSSKLDLLSGKGDQLASTVISNKSKAIVPTSSAPLKKAKQMRLERRQAKLETSQKEPRPKATVQEKSLQDFLSAPAETDKHKLKVRLVHVDDNEFKRTLPQSYELYRKYQIVIHNEPPTDQKAYKNHLQLSPMKHQKSDNCPEMGYGSFHQQYWLDDKLIAVGVIDILPGSVSSVYFFYDPDYSFLSLGTYGSLREIDLVQSIAQSVPTLKYYYMGFYIHSCPKMRYKGKLSASYLLCPETYVWLPLTDAIRSALDAQKYQRLNPDDSAKDVNEFLNQHLDDVTLLVGPQSFITYKQIIQLPVDVRNAIIEYSKLVGRVCAHRMLYVYLT